MVRIASAAALFAAVASVAACLGEDITSSSATTPAARGERGGPCYPNGTCNGGLLCVGGECRSDGEATDAATPATPAPTATADAGSTPSVDSGSSCSVAIPTLPAGPVCPGVGSGSCASGTPCCSKLGVNACEACTNGNDTTWACNARFHCGGKPCCLTTSTLDANTCPVTLSNVGASACEPTKPACDGRQLCASTAECASGTCVAAQFNMGGTKVVLGVCQ